MHVEVYKKPPIMTRNSLITLGSEISVLEGLLSEKKKRLKAFCDTFLSIIGSLMSESDLFLEEECCHIAEGRLRFTVRQGCPSLTIALPLELLEPDCGARLLLAIVGQLSRAGVVERADLLSAAVEAGDAAAVARELMGRSASTGAGELPVWVRQLAGSPGARVS